MLQKLKSNKNQNPQESLYNQGWCWQEMPINWTSYIFYGADVTAEGLMLFETNLQKLTALNLDVSGYFHSQGEDGQQNLIYRITNDIIAKQTEQILTSITSD